MLENNHSQMADIVQPFNMKDNHLLLKAFFFNFTIKKQKERKKNH